MSCFIVRTKSPPVTSSSPTTVLKACPATQPWAAAKNPGSGGRWAPSPLARSSAERSSLTARMRSQRCRAALFGEPRWRRWLRAAVLVDEHGQQPGEFRRLDVVEEAGADGTR